MTAPFIPPVARQQKPVKVEPVFAQVSRAQLSQIPGRRGLPVFGILPEAVAAPRAFTRRMYDRYGPVHRFYACGNWNVQLVGPEANEFVLFDREGNFSSYGGWKPVFGRHFDGGLLLRDGDDHQWHRKLVAYAFKQEQLQAYLDIFSDNMKVLLKRWSERVLESYELAQELTFANGYAAFLGRDARFATRNDLLAFRYLMGSSTSIVTMPFPGNSEWRARWAKRHVEELIRPMLSETPAAERMDLLAVLVRMKQDGQLEDEEIIAHLTFVIAASYDTLSSATVSTLYYLAKHPEWQDEVRSELLANIINPTEIALADLQKCEKVEWVVKEALRLNAAAPVLWRRATRDLEFQGHTIPSGTLTGVNPMLTHLLPEVWGDPEEFRPSRFAPEESRERHRFAFVPFGGGAHGCIGANYAYLQIRTLLRHLLEEHEVVLTSDREPRWYHWPNCRPLGQLPIKLKKL
ncbi:MAG TPA: cytochrome P450 [Allosphingosinicella sp.]|uniref:cytochrome P450 n=1 Tax=Allosphingosinicella sp. TaxID=2823234 RepID=UPI002ED86EFA